ncbi:uncharacterized protein HD556DRAFT_1389919 [Suillus plorans]|uniref:Secreted protein n=1 Tax=Suillus plorans TaxID=116603 RepID=A0A9P7AJC8_9AGAM|nr:uncharacterized protein HD556DRAFT_1389919 [Suillus plorans]KAG1790660.1 hypothetical protein HD556DRAFT_1389919 [Suillus plorans]
MGGNLGVILLPFSALDPLTGKPRTPAICYHQRASILCTHYSLCSCDACGGIAVCKPNSCDDKQDVGTGGGKCARVVGDFISLVNTHTPRISFR